MTTRLYKQLRRLNLRQRTLLKIVIAAFVLITVFLFGLNADPETVKIDFDNRNTHPSFTNLFGTDWLGRDMFFRTLKGLHLSMGVGSLAAITSTMIALALSVLASWNRFMDYIITWLIDLFLSVPHLVILLIVVFAFGGGFKGVVIGISLTHWPSLTRLLRGEINQLQVAEYVQVSEQFGKSHWWIARHHFLPHILPQLIVGCILLFPHAILHEAAITFLGFGLSPEQPAIGIILSESMRYLSTGMWWLAFFPGLSLVLIVSIFDVLGTNIRRLIDPFHGQK